MRRPQGEILATHEHIDVAHRSERWVVIYARRERCAFEYYHAPGRILE